MRPTWQVPEPSDASVDTGRLVSLHFLLEALRRRWIVWVGATLIGAMLGVAWVSLVPPRSTGTVTVFLAHDPNVEPEGAMATDVSLLRTRSVASTLTRALDLDMTPEDFQATVVATTVTPQVLLINVQAPGDGAARERAAGLAEVFLEFRSDQLRAGSDAIVARNRQRVQTLEEQASVLIEEFERLSAEGQQGQSEAAGALTERARLTEEIVRLQQSSEETSLQIEAVLSASDVIDPADVIPRSSVKRSVLTVGSALVGGLVAGVGFVLVTALTSKRLRRRDEVALAVGAPVAASATGRSRSQLASPVRAVVAATDVDGRRVRLAVAAVGRTRDHERIAAEAVLALVQRQRSVFLVDLGERGRLEKLVGRLVRRHARGAALPPVVRPRVPRVFTGSLRLASTGPPRSQQDAQYSAYEASDVVLALAKIDPTTDLDELAAWADEVVLVVAAGRSSAERLHSVAELARIAGMRVSFVVLTRADRRDESLGLASVPPSGDAVDGRTGEVHSDAPRDERRDRRSVR